MPRAGPHRPAARCRPGAGDRGRAVGWVAEHPGHRRPRPGMREAVDVPARATARSGRAGGLPGAGQRRRRDHATQHPRARSRSSLDPVPTHVGLASTTAMRWALRILAALATGALARVGAPVDEGRFKQKAPLRDSGGVMSDQDLFETLERIGRRPAVYSRYTADTLWSSPDISEMMLRYHLDGDVDLASRRDGVRRAPRSTGSSPGSSSAQRSRVIDLGCGPGLYANRLARRGAQVTGRRHLAALDRVRPRAGPAGRPRHRLSARRLPRDGARAGLRPGHDDHVRLLRVLARTARSAAASGRATCWRPVAPSSSTSTRRPTTRPGRRLAATAKA